MALRAHHILAPLLAGAAVLGGLAFFAFDSPSAQATCAAGSSITITQPTSTGTTASPVHGVVTLAATSSPATASGLSFMFLNPAQQPIGEATQSGNEWRFNLDTRNYANGSYQIIGIARYGTDTSQNCASPAAQLYISNSPTQSATLSATLNPTGWSGTIGQSVPFSVDALYTDQYGRSSHVNPVSIHWHANGGTTEPNGGVSTVFRATTLIDSGLITADISYAGLATTASAPIKVTPVKSSTSGGSTVPTPRPSPTAKPVASGGSPATSPLSTSDAARLAAMPTVFRPTKPTNSDPVVNLPTLGCLEKAVGTVRFAEISSGKSQPTAVERKLSASCFSGAEPIPALLAPIAPTHLTELVTTTDYVSVGSVKNQTTITKDGKKVSNLLITGTGVPNTDIFVYVFSDPLVLRAQTDSKGNWSYVLENPLKTGKHEVYAVAEKDAGSFVRTSAVPIQVASAAPGSADGSLVVEHGWSAQQVGFAGGAGLMVVVALGVAFTLLRRRKPAAQLAAPAPAAPLIMPNPASSQSPAAPSPPGAPQAPPKVPTE